MTGGLIGAGRSECFTRACFTAAAAGCGAGFKLERLEGVASGGGQTFDVSVGDAVADTDNHVHHSIRDAMRIIVNKNDSHANT